MNNTGQTLANNVTQRPQCEYWAAFPNDLFVRGLVSRLRPHYCLLILSMCIITFITFQYVIIPKSSVIKCKDLRCTAEAQHEKSPF